MSSGEENSSIPLPEILEYNLNHSFKHQQNINNSFRHTKKPPKLHTKNHDVSFSTSIPKIITFQHSPTAQIINSSIYDVEIVGSYFEQCFEIISKLGEGSFGEVFKVRSKDDGHLYAIKKSKQFYRSGCDRQKQLEEVRRYEQLSQHEHCITLYKAWEQDDRLYMQLELCESNLEEYVRHQQNRLSESMVWNIFLDILLALKALHDINLIHLDIKLDNILIDKENICKLGDFGLVIDLNHANLNNATEGDSRYVAPELLYGRFSKAADIFSLGITILELACDLELPKNGPLWQELRKGIISNECKGLLSLDMENAIRSMMDPDPYRRPDINRLIMIPRLQQLLIARRKQRVPRKIKKYLQFIRTCIWQTWCNLKKQLVNVYLLIMSSIWWTQRKNVDEHNRNMLTEDDSDVDVDGNDDNDTITPKNTPILDKSSMLNVFNSTPLSHNNGNQSWRCRKEQTKPNKSFLDISADNNDNNFYNISPRLSKLNLDTSSTLIAKRLNFASDDEE